MKNVLLIGLGRFGRHIAMQLNQLGHEVMAVDWKEERVDKVLSFVTNAQIGDSTNAEFLLYPSFSSSFCHSPSTAVFWNYITQLFCGQNFFFYAMVPIR